MRNERMVTDWRQRQASAAAPRRPARASILPRLLALLVLCLASWLHAAPAIANTCGPATTQGTAPSDFQHYCWLDFSGYSNSTAKGGQAFSFTLPDGSTLSLTLTTSGTANALTAASSPSWSGAAFGNSAFLGIPGKPVLYQQVSGATNTVTLSNIKITPPGGGSGQVSYSIVAADGESTNNGESLSFSTNAGAWKLLAQVSNGSYYPTVSGVGTTTVTETGTQGGSAGSFVFGSFNNPTQVSAQIVGSGLQGVVFAVRFASLSVTTAINGSRVDPSDQFTYGIKTSNGTAIATKTSSGTGAGPFPLAVSPNISASYSLVVNEIMATGSANTLANYTESLTCTNASTTGSTTVVPTKLNATTYTFASLQYGDDIGCVFTNTPFPGIAGTVYNDLNHNLHIDPGESGTSLTGLYVKLAPLSGGVCQSPAAGAAAVNATTGAYVEPGVSPGSYCLILDGNNTLGDVTPSLPSGWVGTEASSGIRQVTMGSTSPPVQNFGLYQGMTLSGIVFADTGVGSGIANNGVRDGGETGIASVTVNALSGSTNVGSAATDGGGVYTVWVPATVSGSVVITPAAPTGYLATGGSAGSSGGSYSRPSVTITASSGLTGTGVNFGLVPPNTLAPDGAQSATPGSVLFYAHQFVAGSGGTVTFSSAATAAPVVAGWSELLYRDANCNGQLDTGETQVTGTIAVTAGQTLCLLVKEFVPATAPLNAQNKVIVSAAFSYSNASPALAATQARTDITTVTLAGALRLVKLVSNQTQGSGAGTSNNASPGDTLRYQLTVSNPGSHPISQLVVTDATPAFTQFVSAACPAPASLPAGLTACSVSSKPAVGAQGEVSWTFVGSLAPGATTEVSYQVTVSP